MKTLIALAGIAALSVAGVAEMRPQSAKPQAKTEEPRTAADLERAARSAQPIPPAPKQPGNPPPFDPLKPIFVLVPSGVDGIPAGVHPLGMVTDWDGQGRIWRDGGSKYSYAFSVRHHPATPTFPGAEEMTLWYFIEDVGNITVTGPFGTPVTTTKAFSVSGAIKADGTFGQEFMWRFPAATVPFVVWQ